MIIRLYGRLRKLSATFQKAVPSAASFCFFYADFFDDRFGLFHMHARSETGERLAEEWVSFE